MKRRCVICGVEPTNDVSGNPNYHFPKSKKEARIWQRSLNANNIPLDAIQKYCCVCIDHIPQFVDEAQKQALQVENENANNVRGGGGACCCDTSTSGDFPGPNRAAVSVLLMTGATLPSYCGQACGLPIETSDFDMDADVCVLESSFFDSGAKFPDIDTTEFTVMRAPIQHEKVKNPEEDEEEEEEEESLEKSEDCTHDCTDVLLLGRGRHPTDECPCNCEFCVKPTPIVQEECCKPCCPEPPRYDQPPCGCECEQQVRRQLGKIIEEQQARIRELEDTLFKQNNWHQCLQYKVDELYSEFGRNYPDTKTADCKPSQISQEPEVKKEENQVPKNEKEKETKKIKPTEERKSVENENENVDKPAPSENDERIHYYLKKTAAEDRTKRPNWMKEE